MMAIKKIKLLIQSFYSLIRIIYHNDITGFNKLNKELSSIKKLSVLRILGNGKSLNENLNAFKYQNSDYLVVNRHVLSSSYKEIKPIFYVLADPHFFIHSEGVDIVKKINQDTSWELRLFVPYSRIAVKNVPLLISNKLIKVVYYNHVHFDGFSGLKQLFFKKNLAMPKIQNVLVASIYIGICASYNRIELYGVEHSWTKYLTVDSDNDVCLQNPHFFDSCKPKVQKWKEIQHENAKLHEVLRMYAQMFESYWELEAFATKLNVNIINCTAESFIDAFKKQV